MKRRIIRRVARTLLSLLLMCTSLIVLYALYIVATPYRSEALPQLANGDIVFQTDRTSQTLAIMFATHSLYTHVGVVKMMKGAPHVVEAVGPVRVVPLDKWARSGIGNRISVGRVEGLTSAQGLAVVKAAERYLGRPYDFFFLSDDRAIYCSELVYKAYADGMGLSVGKEQKVGELYVDNFAVRNIIRKRWMNYPPCRGLKGFEDCYAEIMSQPLVSPVALSDDAKVKRIYSNYGILF